MGKIISFIVFVLIAIGIVYGFSFLQAGSFASMTQHYVEFQSLVMRPDFYNGKRVCTVGTYLEELENTSLRDLNKENNSTIWIDAPVEKTLLGNIQDWTSRTIGVPDSNNLTSTIKVCGTFEHQGSKRSGFGYLGLYKYRISQ